MLFKALMANSTKIAQRRHYYKITYIIIYCRTVDNDYKNKLDEFYNANTYMRVCKKKNEKKKLYKTSFFLVFVFSLRNYLCASHGNGIYGFMYLYMLAVVKKKLK